MRRLVLMLGLFVVATSSIAADEPQATKDSAEKKTPKTLAVFRLKGPLSESPMAEDLPFATPGESLKSLVDRLDKASKDDSIEAVVVLLDGAAIGTAQIEEVRTALDGVRQSGKEVFAHCDTMDTGDYVLLSGVSRLSVAPTGDVWISGLYGEGLYLRGLFDWLGIEPDFTTCGDYKSAAEMFTRKTPSPEAQKNRDWLLDGIYGNYVGAIARGRKVSEQKVKDWIDYGMYSAERAEKAGIIDAVETRSHFESKLKKRYGDDARFDKRYAKKKRLDIDLSSPFGLFKFYADLLAGPSKAKSTKSAVAIVYVEGPIMVGSAGADPLSFAGSAVAYSSPLRKALLKAARDDSVKAVVMRVNSPGGSAVASEIILQASKEVAAKKPLIVSMGDVAGSGGYYVACGTETIFVDPSTITGSIGVVGGKLATNEMWKKMGINWSSTQRGKNADALLSGDPFTDEQRQMLQTWMDEVYEVFKGHVVAIRGDKLKKDIDELAGGRVYTGQQALELGLVDQIGGLRDAIAHAAEEAGLEKYEVRILPKPLSLIDILLGGDQKDDDPQHLEATASLPLRGVNRTHWAAGVYGQFAPALEQADPERVEMVKQALLQLSILRGERVGVSMPLISIRQ